MPATEQRAVAARTIQVESSLDDEDVENIDLVDGDGRENPNSPNKNKKTASDRRAGARLKPKLTYLGGQKVVRAVSNVGDRVDALRDRMAFLRRKEGNGNGGDDGEMGGLAAAGFGPAA